MKLALFRLMDRLKGGCWPVYWLLYRLYKSLGERSEMKLMRQMVRPGSWVIDIGANVGFYTLYLSRLVGPEGRVLAFEPSPSNFALLQKNCAGLPNVILEQAAVGASSGMVALYESPDLNVDHKCYEDGEKRHRIDVPVHALDEYLAAHKIADLSFLKMDVQGYEGQVLEGMPSTLRTRFEMSVLSEIFPVGLRTAGRSPEFFLQALSGSGFCAWLLQGGQFLDAAEIDYGSWPADQYGNIFAWKKTKAPEPQETPS